MKNGNPNKQPEGRATGVPAASAPPEAGHDRKPGGQAGAGTTLPSREARVLHPAIREGGRQQQDVVDAPLVGARQAGGGIQK